MGFNAKKLNINSLTIWSRHTLSSHEQRRITSDENGNGVKFDRF